MTDLIIRIIVGVFAVLMLIFGTAYSIEPFWKEWRPRSRHEIILRASQLLFFCLFSSWLGGGLIHLELHGWFQFWRVFAVLLSCGVIGCFIGIREAREEIARKRKYDLWLYEMNKSEFPNHLWKHPDEYVKEAPFRPQLLGALKIWAIMAAVWVWFTFPDIIPGWTILAVPLAVFWGYVALQFLLRISTQKREPRTKSNPGEPRCSGNDAHDWQSPSFVGKTMSGMISECCMRCGCARLIIKWEGLPDTVKYTPGEYVEYL